MSHARSTEGTLSRKTRGYIYREAARRLEVGSHKSTLGESCVEICCVQRPDLEPQNAYKKRDPLVVAYERHFKPSRSWDSCWGSAWDYDERRDCRVLALCFMAAMVEAGDV